MDKVCLAGNKFPPHRVDQQPPGYESKSWIHGICAAGSTNTRACLLQVQVSAHLKDNGPCLTDALL